MTTSTIILSILLAWACLGAPLFVRESIRPRPRIWLAPLFGPAVWALMIYFVIAFVDPRKAAQKPE